MAILATIKVGSFIVQNAYIHIEGYTPSRMRKALVVQLLAYHSKEAADASERPMPITEFAPLQWDLGPGDTRKAIYAWLKTQDKYADSKDILED